mmetsp:Transcript_79796/g.222123  ORF Transcript_79796/g.222123 Transcript_79796/m.222123 type:complete len:665 (-) Transcript_79796:69-2063(-)
MGTQETQVPPASRTALGNSPSESPTEVGSVEEEDRAQVEDRADDILGRWLQAVVVQSNPDETNGVEKPEARTEALQTVAQAKPKKKPADLPAVQDADKPQRSKRKQKKQDKHDKHDKHDKQDRQDKEDKQDKQGKRTKSENRERKKEKREKKVRTSKRRRRSPDVAPVEEPGGHAESHHASSHGTAFGQRAQIDAPVETAAETVASCAADRSWKDLADGLSEAKGALENGKILEKPNSAAHGADARVVEEERGTMVAADIEDSGRKAASTQAVPAVVATQEIPRESASLATARLLAAAPNLGLKDEDVEETSSWSSSDAEGDRNIVRQPLPLLPPLPLQWALSELDVAAKTEAARPAAGLGAPSVLPEDREVSATPTPPAPPAPGELERGASATPTPPAPPAPGEVAAAAAAADAKVPLRRPPKVAAPHQSQLQRELPPQPPAQTQSQPQRGVRPQLQPQFQSQPQQQLQPQHKQQQQVAAKAKAKTKARARLDCFTSSSDSSSSTSSVVAGRRLERASVVPSMVATKRPAPARGPKGVAGRVGITSSDSDSSTTSTDSDDRKGGTTRPRPTAKPGAAGVAPTQTGAKRLGDLASGGKMATTRTGTQAIPCAARFPRKGKVCAKMLVRAHVRCSCHFAMMRDCPTPRGHAGKRAAAQASQEAAA